MKKEDLQQFTDKQLSKEIKEYEDFLSEETSSTGKRDYIWLEWLYKEAEKRNPLKNKNSQSSLKMRT